MLGDSIAPIRKFLGLTAAVALAWVAFEVVIQPGLVSINPVFADQPFSEIGFSGRTPDTLAQAAFVVTLLLGVYIYFLLKILVFEGVDEFLEWIKASLLILGIPLIMINKILPEKFQFYDTEG
jgi:hypothetical protein